MNELLKELDKFYQTYEPKIEFELGFQKQKKKSSNSKDYTKIPSVEPNSKLNWI
jgi:hypothetical protein